MSTPRFCKVSLPLPIKGVFDYAIPEGMDPKPGCRVMVPFGRRAALGVVTELAPSSEFAKVKSLTSQLDAEPLISKTMLEFTHWIAEYYLCGWGEVLPLALPPLVKGKRLKPWKDGEGLTPTKAPPKLTEAQKKAVKAIKEGLETAKPAAFLLHGVTGSGKTEVYLHALEAALDLGGGAIVLVPEIALTPQTLERFEGRFPGMVAVLHSGLTATERLRSFEALRSGRAKVALGARSALFAPVKDLKLIVVDEESEPSYKQESVPRYHARDAALVRAKMENAVTLLGSATPSFESFYNARSGKLTLLHLPGRVGQAGMPQFEFVDLNALGAKNVQDDALSPALVKALNEAKQAGEQSLIFLNRRGFAPVMCCAKCGQSIQCPNCSISLTFHKDMEGGSLRCHLCGHSRRPPTLCADEKCGSKNLKLLGTGTQRLEEELRRVMPGVRALRVDRDSVGGSASAEFHRELGAQVHAGSLDVLLGTQMLAKGLDFPNLTLVGVVNADASLAFPDFRAEERTYQLLVQVAGRCGRADKPGRVLVQTRQDDHPCLRAAAKQDFEAFYEARIGERKDLGYPPFGRMAALILRSEDKAKAMQAASDLAVLLEKEAQKSSPRRVQILGPAPSPLIQVKTWWRYRILVKAADSKSLHALLDPLVFEHSPKGALLAVDVDPVNFL
ncbi:MAG: primosomal protein N' [candidate division FCPU426 bacterium]